MSWRFNPPPGWPPQPAGWVPPPGWTPDPSWPPAPAGWQFWLPAGANPAPAGPGAAGPGAAGSFDTTPGLGRGWLIVALVALLLVGSGLGYGGTRVALGLTAGDPGSPADLTGGQPSPGDAGPDLGTEPPATPGTSGPSPPADPGQPSAPQPPVIPSIAPPPGGFGGQVCGEVALIMLQMLTTTSDPDQSRESVVESWRTAAEQLRNLAETEDEPDRASLAAFAAEIEAAVQAVEQNPSDQGTFESSFGQMSDGYQTFNDQTC